HLDVRCHLRLDGFLLAGFRQRFGLEPAQPCHRPRSAPALARADKAADAAGSVRHVELPGAMELLAAEQGRMPRQKGHGLLAIAYAPMLPRGGNRNGRGREAPKSASTARPTRVRPAAARNGTR